MKLEFNRQDIIDALTSVAETILQKRDGWHIDVDLSSYPLEAEARLVQDEPKEGEQ